MARTLRWGIMGTGNIARQFTDGLAGSARGKAVAVGSRQLATARDFAAARSISAAYASYDELIADKNVDAIYVSLPNSMHHEWTIKSLNAGKHVLCEKPFANDAAESEEMFDVAAKKGLALVEAFMYRSHPLTHAVVEQVRNGAIGDIRVIRTSFCYCTHNIAGNVRFSVELHGGALMDIGCYCTSFSLFYAGAAPTKIAVTGHIHDTGVDDYVTGTMSFPNGAVANFACGMTVHADNTAYLCGSEGYIAIPIPWKPPVTDAEFIVTASKPPLQDRPKKVTQPGAQSIKVDAGKPLYALEADDFAACVHDGAAPAVSKSDTLNNMKVIDEMRRQVGLSF